MYTDEFREALAVLYLHRADLFALWRQGNLTFAQDL